MTGRHRAAATDAAPEDRSCLDLKHLYLEELHRIVATKKPGGRGIRRIIDHTEAHPVGLHRPDGHRTWVWSDLHLRHANIIKYCKRPFPCPAASSSPVLLLKPESTPATRAALLLRSRVDYLLNDREPDANVRRA